MILRILISTTLFCASLLALWESQCLATDIIVTNNSEFSTALATASSGDRILLAPGNYNGSFFQSGLNGVTIRSQFPGNPAIIVGGGAAIQLSDATNVTIEHLICEGQTGNGLNIDDGGTFNTPSTNITIRNVIVRNLIATGNNDGIKLSGVTGFTIDSVQVLNWGNNGSAVDPVGCHHGLIQNSLFRHDSLGPTGSGVRPKGGSKDIVIRGNRVEIPGANGRAIQAGGSTGSQFFRFIDGDSDYEASEIRVEGNVVVTGSAAFSFVNIDGGHFHHNYVHRPQVWFIRILNENAGNSIVDTRNGLLENNVMVFNDTASEFNRAVNIGTETAPETFTFIGNQWYNIADPANSTPSLPSTEIGQVVGVPPQYEVDEAMGWSFDWGLWIVNANETAKVFNAGPANSWLQANPGVSAEYDPLLPNPFIGDWTFQTLSSTTISLPGFSQAWLIPVSELLGPSGQKFLDGVSVGGQLSDVHFSDNQYLQVDPSPTTNLLKQKVDIVFQAEADSNAPDFFSIHVESKMIGGPAGDVLQQISLWNYQTSDWEIVDTRSAKVTDELVEISASGDVNRFLQQQVNEVTAKVTWTSASFSGTPFTWSIDIDQMTWLVLE